MIKEYYSIKEVAEKLKITTNGVMYYIKRNNLTNLLETNKNGLLTISNDNYVKLVKYRKDKQMEMLKARAVATNNKQTKIFKSNNKSSNAEMLKEYADIFLKEKDKQIAILQSQIEDLKEDLRSKDVIINNLITNNAEQLKILNATSQLVALQEPKAKRSLLDKFLGREVKA